MIRVVTNDMGSGDWVTVLTGGRDGFEELHSGHRITAHDLVMILQNLGHHSELVEVTDQQMEEQDY